MQHLLSIIVITTIGIACAGDAQPKSIVSSAYRLARTGSTALATVVNDAFNAGHSAVSTSIPVVRQVANLEWRNLPTRVRSITRNDIAAGLESSADWYERQGVYTQSIFAAFATWSIYKVVRMAMAAKKAYSNWKHSPSDASDQA